MKYLITHGSFGSPDKNWFRWLEKELKSLGHEVILEQFPVDDWDKLNKLGIKRRGEYKVTQSLVSWEKFFLDKILPMIKDGEFIFIGHSISPVFFLHMLERHDLRVGKAVFVAPFLHLEDNKDIWQFYPVNKSFYKTDFDFNLINSKVKTPIVVYGDNDPYVPIKYPKEFAEKLNAKTIIIPNGGHCGSNFTKFPEVLNLLIEDN